METKPQDLTYKVNENKTIECIYYFTDDYLPSSSDSVNLMVRLDGVDDPELHHIIEAVKKEFMNQPEETIRQRAIAMLDSLYNKD